MKRILGTSLVLALAIFLSAALAFAANAPAHKAAAPASKTINGEIVDLGCYLGRGAKGAAHKECAATCVNNGGPMGLLTDKGMLYVLTMNHENPDAFNSAKKHAGDMVKVTGAVSIKNAMRSLEVNGVEAI